jgi:antitoxin VapB
MSLPSSTGGFLDEIKTPSTTEYSVSTLVSMTATAKLFKHGGSQAVRLPKAFRFEGEEVEIEKRGKDVVLRALEKPKFRTVKELAEHLHAKYPGLRDFPDVPRPKEQQIRDLTW